MNVNEDLEQIADPLAPEPRRPATETPRASHPPLRHGSRPPRPGTIDPAWWTPAVVDPALVAREPDPEDDADIRNAAPERAKLTPDPGVRLKVPVTAGAPLHPPRIPDPGPAVTDDSDAKQSSLTDDAFPDITNGMEGAESEENSRGTRLSLGDASRDPSLQATDPATDPAIEGPAHEPQDELLASLGRRFRGATLKLEFELRTSVARQVFRRDFIYVSQQLHALEASRRVQGIDRQRLRDALAAVSARAEAVRSLLLQYAARARSLIQAHEHAGADVAFARPTRLRATIISPYARDFLEIIGQADDALTQLEKAWLLGLIDAPAKSQQASECRRALQGFKEVVRQQRHIIGEHVREVNAARRTAVPLGLADPNSSDPEDPESEPVATDFMPTMGGGTGEGAPPVGSTTGTNARFSVRFEDPAAGFAAEHGASEGAREQETTQDSTSREAMYPVAGSSPGTLSDAASTTGKNPVLDTRFPDVGTAVHLDVDTGADLDAKAGEKIGADENTNGGVEAVAVVETNAGAGAGVNADTDTDTDTVVEVEVEVEAEVDPDTEVEAEAGIPSRTHVDIDIDCLEDTICQDDDEDSYSPFRRARDLARGRRRKGRPHEGDDTV